VEDIERIKERLDNIQGVEPIITSLRTIAAGGWRLALRRVGATRQYVEHLREVMSVLVPLIGPEELQRNHVAVRPVAPRRPAVVVIASERGLCGAFNDIVLEGAERLIAQQQLQAEEVALITLGARATNYFRARGRPLLMAEALPVTRVAPLSLVQHRSGRLMELLEAGEVDAIQVVYSPYEGSVTVPPVMRRWLPVEASALPNASVAWPQPIVETEPSLLFQGAIETWALAQLYQMVMESAASEQSARFRAMDSASSNLAKVIEELTLAYHSARQHAITMEMLDLVAGAGILRGSRERGKR
jgi:F-type H+-transporting ATPase subunit gamma